MIADERPDILAAFSLSPDRAQLATSMDKHVLVLAGPGAGKTHLLVAHAVWLAEKDVGRVVLLTYSRKAAAELKRRADAALSFEGRRRVVAATIHGYALDLLHTHGHRIGIVGEVEPIDTKDLQLLADEVARRDALPLFEGFAARFQAYQRLRGDLKAPDLPPLVGRVDAEMRARARIDWDSCVRLATELLASDPEVCASVRHHDRNVLLDEAQDCDAGQLAFVESVVGSPPGAGHLFVVMDPDQSLYAFRQANPDVVRSWALSYAHEEKEVTENFRCAPRIQALARISLGKSFVGAMDHGSTSLQAFASEEAEGAWIANDVYRRLKLGIQPQRIAVISRRRSRLTSVEAALSSHVKVRTDPREQWTPPEERVLAAIAFIRDWRDESAAEDVVMTFLVEVAGFDADAARALLLEALRKDQHVGDLLALEWWRQLVEWLEERRSPEDIVVKLGPTARAGDDLRSLRAMARQARSLSELLRLARGGPDSATAGAAQEPAVLVTTFHGVKGLEFDVVFIVGCEDGTIPDFRSQTEHELHEERRALYVAITRASTDAVLTYVTMQRGYRKSPSRFLPDASQPVWLAL